MQFKVIPHLEKVDYDVLFGYSGMPEMTYGLRFGFIGKWGMFLDIKASPGALEMNPLAYDKTWETTSYSYIEASEPIMSNARFLLGFSKSLFYGFHIYMNAGYGFQNYYTKRMCDIQGDVLENTGTYSRKVYIEDRSSSLAELVYGGGVIVNIKKLYFSAGMDLLQSTKAKEKFSIGNFTKDDRGVGIWNLSFGFGVTL